MVFFDLAGLVMGALAFALVWGADILLGPASTASPLVAGWLTLVCVAGTFYDRLSPHEGLRAYYRWAGSIASGAAPRASRVAVLGMPLVLWPATACVFGVVFPLVHGDELPPVWFFTVGLLTPVALLIQHTRTRHAG
jgi:hypothetical protein